MKIYVNGQITETTSQTLYELMIELDFDLECIATAIDGEFVSKTKYQETLLKVNQKIEVLSPMQGG